MPEPPTGPVHLIWDEGPSNGLVHAPDTGSTKIRASPNPKDVTCDVCLDFLRRQPVPDEAASASQTPSDGPETPSR